MSLRARCAIFSKLALAAMALAARMADVYMPLVLLLREKERECAPPRLTSPGP